MPDAGQDSNPEELPPEEELARRFQAGDEAVFDRLVELLEGRVYRVAYRITRRNEDALDVLQETFIKAFERIDSWNRRARFTSWLYRIATNAAIDRIRKRKRRRKAYDGVVEEGRDLVDPGHVPEIVERSQTRKQMAQIDRAIRDLPDAQRTTMILRHYEGCSLKEIAEIRDVALGTVKSTLHQAFHKLKDALVPETGEGVSDAGS